MQATEPNQARVESRDVEVRGIFWFVAALLISGVVITIVLWGMFRFFEAELAGQDPEDTPVVAEQRKREPPSADPAGRFPQPRLQFNAAEENARHQFAEERILSSYGWVDARTGVARIPIDRAMDLVAQRGLPARPEGGE
ncbi:MAG: hypothetical protein L0099_06760 [Acidobacteria bacterium]|nr:hypothetical protein [Acidobacteriota bacterium]